MVDKIGVQSLDLTYSPIAQTIINPLGQELQLHPGWILSGIVNIGKLIVNLHLTYYNQKLEIIINTPKGKQH